MMWKLPFKRETTKGTGEYSQELVSVEPLPWTDRFSQLSLRLGFPSFTSPITKEDVQRLVIASCSPFSPEASFAAQGLMMIGDALDEIFGPFTSSAEKTDYQMEWCKQAPEFWLGPLLEVCVQRPSLEKFGPRIGEDWDAELSLILGYWGEANPTHWAQIIELMRKKTLRQLVLGALWAAGSAESLTHFHVFWNDIGSFTEDELVSLIDAVGYTVSPHSKGLLKEIRPHISSRMSRALHEYDLFMARIV